MIVEITSLVILTIIASGVGTLTGFGTSTIMVPILLLFLPLPIVLLFAGIIHWFGDIWKIVFFRSGIRWRLLFLFGASGLVATYFGASLVLAVPEEILSRLLGVFLLAYIGWLAIKPNWQLPERADVAAAGGALSGFFAGIFGVGGAVRGAFLAAYNLPKEVHLFTVGSIALIIDSTRLAAYLSEGIRLPDQLQAALIAAIPASLIGAYIAKRIITRIPQEKFRLVVTLFLAIVAVKLVAWP